MKSSEIIFGTFTIGIGSISYTAPANLTHDMIQCISFDERKEIEMPMIISPDENEVTHEVFFGENVKRVINTLTIT